MYRFISNQYVIKKNDRRMIASENKDKERDTNE